MMEKQHNISAPPDDGSVCECLHAYTALPFVELICYPGRRSHKPLRNWKKSQKKIRRERRQRRLK